MDAGTLDVVRADGSSERYRIQFLAGGHAGYPLSYFDSISPAVDYEIEKLAHHRRKGYGAPLVALRENRLRDPLERFYPPEAITRPLTAVIEDRGRRGGQRNIRVELLLSAAQRRGAGGWTRASLGGGLFSPMGSDVGAGRRLEQVEGRGLIEPRAKA